MTSGKLHDKRFLLEVVSALGQMGVACAGIACWSLVAGTAAGWFWAGAALWAVAVALKLLCAQTAGKSVTGFLHAQLSYSGFVVSSGLYTGIQSSAFEMGLTLLAVFIWPSLGQEAGRAIAVGIGAGAVEALLLGASGLISACYGPPGTTGANSGKAPETSATPLFWLLGTVERIIALLCHASSRALLLLGAVHGSYYMIFWGVALFSLLDGVAGAVHVSGKVRTVSLWWIELTLLPFALISIPILLWCYEKFGL